MARRPLDFTGFTAGYYSETLFVRQNRLEKWPILTQLVAVYEFGCSHALPLSYSPLRRRLDVLQVGIVAGDHPRKHILRNVLGVHGGFREEPEQGHLREFVELMIPDLA